MGVLGRPRFSARARYVAGSLDALVTGFASVLHAASHQKTSIEPYVSKFNDGSIRFDAVGSKNCTSPLLLCIIAAVDASNGSSSSSSTPR